MNLLSLTHTQIFFLKLLSLFLSLSMVFFSFLKFLKFCLFFINSIASPHYFTSSLSCLSLSLSLSHLHSPSSVIFETKKAGVTSFLNLDTLEFKFKTRSGLVEIFSWNKIVKSNPLVIFPLVRKHYSEFTSLEFL